MIWPLSSLKLYIYITLFRERNIDNDLLLQKNNIIKSLLVIRASACTIMVQSQAVIVNSENILFGTLDFEDADSVEILLTNVLD